MKRLLLITLTLGITVAIHAQKMKFSVEASPQFAWLSSDEDNVTPSGSILNFRTGIEMDLFFAENYAFTLGFGVNNMGGNILYSDSTYFISNSDSVIALPGQILKHKLRYIDIPLGLKLKTEELGYKTFFIQLGFNPMINLSAIAISEDGQFDKENISEDTNLFSLCYNVGAGVEYRLGGSTALIGGIRWTSGLNDVTGSDMAKITLNSISIHLGILF